MQPLDKKKENITLIKEDTTTKRKISFTRWVGRIITYTIVSLIAFVVIASYSFDYVVKLTIQERFNLNSKGDYKMHIEDLNTNFFKQSVEVSGVSIFPIGELADSVARIKNKQKVIQFKLKHGTLIIKDVKRYLLNDSLYVANFHFESLDFTLWNYTHDTLKKDPRLQLKEVLKKYTSELMIDSFSIIHASLNVHSSNQEEFFTHHVPDLSIHLKKVIINDLSSENDLLFTPVYDISINDYNYIKGDHRLKVGNIHAKGNQKRITITNLVYQKGKEKKMSFPLINLVKPNVSYYIYQHKIKFDTLLLTNPNLNLQEITHASSTSKTIKGNFLKIIKSFTTEIKSQHIGIKNADISFERLGINGEGSKKIRINDLTLKIDKTDISEETILDKSKVIFSDNILISFKQLDFKNQKNETSISLGNFRSTINDQTQTLNNISINVPHKMKVAIRSVNIKKMNWKKLWDKEEIELQDISVNYPSINLSTNNSKTSKEEIVTQVPTLLFENLAYKVDIDKLLVNRGQFKQIFHGSSIGIKSQQAKNINVAFRDIHFEKRTPVAQPIKKAINEIKHLSFTDYELIPYHNNYKIQAKTVKITPQKQELDITGIRLDVKNKIDLEVSSFKLLGLDWKDYLNTHQLAITKVLINEPVIRANIKAKQTKQRLTQPHQNLKKIIPEVLFDFGSTVSVDSVVLKNGLVHIRSGRKERVTQQADSLNVLITGFSIDSTFQNHNRFLFSDDISLSLKNYELTSDSSGLRVSAALLDVPSSDSLISISKISVKNGKSDSISIPNLVIKEIDWNRFWNQDSLIINTISIETPIINLSTKKILREKEQTQSLPQLENILPHGLVKHLRLNNGSIRLKQDTTGTHVAKQLDIHIEDFVFDSTFMKHKLPVKNLSFYIKEYEFENTTTSKINAAILKGDTENGDLYIEGFHFSTNEIDLTTPQVQLTGFGLNTLYNNKKIVFNGVKLIDPEINYVMHSSFRHENRKDSSSLLDKLFNKITDIEGNSLKIINGSVSVILPNSYHKLNHLNSEFEDISISPSTLASPDRILCSKQIQLKFQNYSYINEDKLQLLNFDSFEASSIDSLLKINNFTYSPTITETDFLDKIRHRKTFFSMTSKQIFSSSFNFYDLYNNHKILARKLVIESPDLMIAENLKKERRKNKIPDMPNNLIRELPFYLNINELEVHKANIIYNERAKKGSGTGTIYFTKTDALLENITNDPALMSHKHPAVIRAHTQFMDQGSLSMIMTIPLLDKDFTCEYQGVLGSMDAEIINEMIIPNANLGLKKGEVRRISFNAKVQRGIAKGEMLAKYRSFKLEVYSKNQKRKTILGTFFSNLLISKNNRKKKGKIYYKSSSTDSFVKILWGGIRSGLIDTLLPGFVVKKV